MNNAGHHSTYKGGEATPFVRFYTLCRFLNFFNDLNYIKEGI